MARKRKIIRDVRCTVRLIVGGTCRKTVKRAITMAQALREIGGDPVAAEGRILTGIPLNKKRTVARGVSVVLMYVADHQPQASNSHGIPAMNMQGSIGVIRAGVQI